MEEGLAQMDLSKEVESPFGRKSKAELLDFFAWHEGYHVGQVVLLKSALSSEV